MKALLLLSAVAVTSVAATLNAQGVTSKPDSTCTKYSDGRVECRVIRGRMPGDSAFGNRMFFRMDSAMAKRAALGLELRATGTRRDTLGVFVAAVTPKGPAEVAGIIEGDRIAAINGVDLRTPAADVEDSYSNGLAPHRLTREVQKLTPGNRVTLRVYSGGRFRDVQVVAGKASDVMRLGNPFNIGFPGPEGMMRFDGPDGMIGPDIQMLRTRIEPLLRERMQNLPNTIRFRNPVRVRTLAPTRAPRTIRVERGVEDESLPAEGAIIRPLNGEDLILGVDVIPDLEEGTFFLDVDDDPFEIESLIEPVTAAAIRDLVSGAIRDAECALKQLAADGVA